MGRKGKAKRKRNGANHGNKPSTSPPSARTSVAPAALVAVAEVVTPAAERSAAQEFAKLPKALMVDVLESAGADASARSTKDALVAKYMSEYPEMSVGPADIDDSAFLSSVPPKPTKTEAAERSAAEEFAKLPKALMVDVLEAAGESASARSNKDALVEAFSNSVDDRLAREEVRASFTTQTGALASPESAQEAGSEREPSREEKQSQPDGEDQRSIPDTRPPPAMPAAGAMFAGQAAPKSDAPTPRKRKASVPPQDQAERRTTHRVELDVEIGFLSASNFYTGFAEDLSDGGIFVATFNLLPIGTALLISFGLPDGRMISTPAKVAWIRDPYQFDSDFEPGMGVAFEDLAPADAKAIREFIACREPIFYDS